MLTFEEKKSQARQIFLCLSSLHTIIGFDGFYVLTQANCEADPANFSLQIIQNFWNLKKSVVNLA